MLSDEEKHAIDYLKIYIERDVMHENCHYKQIEIILNLIEKQSKEIEALKEDNKKKSIVIIEYQDLYEKLEDKIKAKIEDILNSENSEAIEKLIEWQSLLEKE